MNEILTLTRQILEDGSLIRLVLGNKRKKSVPYGKVVIRPFAGRDGVLYQAEYVYENKVLHENLDPEELLDVDKCVAKYGGELDSFYEELPTDEPSTGFEPGHELTERNHALRVMKTVGTSRFFKKRIKDNAKVKETEACVGQLFPGHGDKKSERKRERDKVLHNRFISLNKIIECGRLTNQEKLMMYGKHFGGCYAGWSKS